MCDFVVLLLWVPAHSVRRHQAVQNSGNDLFNAVGIDGFCVFCSKDAEAWKGWTHLLICRTACLLVELYLRFYRNDCKA